MYMMYVFMFRCGGVLIETVILKDKPARTDLDIGLKTLKFVPFSHKYNDVSTSSHSICYLKDNSMNNLSCIILPQVLRNLYVTMQIVAEHFGRNSINVLTINDKPRTNFLNKIKNLLCSEPEIQIDVTDINIAEATNKIYQIKQPDLVFINDEVFTNQVRQMLHTINQLPVIKSVIHDKQNHFQILNQLHHSLPRETFLLTLGVDTKYINPILFKSIFVAGKKGINMELFKRVQLKKAENIVFPVKNTSELLRLQKLRKDLSSQQSLTVVTTYPPISGVKKIIQQLRAEDSFQVHLAMINSKKAELDQKKLQDLDLAVNVFENVRDN